MLLTRQECGKHIRVGESELRYLSDSKRPNAEIDGLELFPTRKLKPGAEIWIYYGDDWDEVESRGKGLGVD